MRSKISSKLIFASCVWYSDRAYYELCVLIKDIGRRPPLQLQCSYQGQQDDLSLRRIKYIYRYFSRGLFFSPMTPGFTNEKQAYERTVYLLLIDHKVTLLSIFYLTNKQIKDDTRIRTSEGHQDYKRTVYYVLDHKVSQQQWCIYDQY